jgi:hypothetical protein
MIILITLYFFLIDISNPPIVVDTATIATNSNTLDVQPNMRDHATQRAGPSTQRIQTQQQAPRPDPTTINALILNDPVKLKNIQKHLIVLIHAQNCQRRQNESPNSMVCGFAYCRLFKEVLNHMSACTLGRTCPRIHCSMSRQLNNHWENCDRSDCRVCSPIRTIDVLQNIANSVTAGRRQSLGNMKRQLKQKIIRETILTLRFQDSCNLSLNLHPCKTEY